jgi:toxin FitB
VKFLLDTMVVSEWVKARLFPSVVSWLAKVDEDRVFLSVVTLAELRYGVARMPASARRTRLDAWLRNELPLRFEGRVLPVDGIVADAWGAIVARSEAAGQRMGVMDAFIGATAEVHGMTLVTRNTSDFEPSLQAIINPWEHDI